MDNGKAVYWAGELEKLVKQINEDVGPTAATMMLAASIGYSVGNAAPTIQDAGDTLAIVQTLMVETTQKVFYAKRVAND